MVKFRAVAVHSNIGPMYQVVRKNDDGSQTYIGQKYLAMETAQSHADMLNWKAKFYPKG